MGYVRRRSIEAHIARAEKKISRFVSIDTQIELRRQHMRGKHEGEEKRVRRDGCPLCEAYFQIQLNEVKLNGKRTTQVPIQLLSRAPGDGRSRGPVVSGGGEGNPLQGGLDQVRTRKQER